MNQNTFRQQSGATYVEMAISILVFMMIIISVLELLRFSFVTVSVQHTLQKGLEAATKANFTTAGCVNTQPNQVLDALEAPATRANCIVNEIIKIANDMSITVTPPMVTVSRPVRATETQPAVPRWRCESSLASPFGPLDAAAGGEIVAICIRTRLPLFSFFTSSAQMDFIVFGRNEIFRYEKDSLVFP